MLSVLMRVIIVEREKHFGPCFCKIREGKGREQCPAKEGLT